MEKRNNNLTEREYTQDFWEDNPDVAGSFQFPFFDECPFLRSDLGKFLAKAIDRRIKLFAIRLAAVISSLPEDQRQIYLLYACKRRSFREISILFPEHDHKWVIRRFKEAAAAIEKATSCLMGHKKTGDLSYFVDDSAPSDR